MEGKRILVVSAHAADYVWRSGGTIAKYIKHGANVDVVVLSFGVRGESAAQWKKEGATYDTVKQNRLEETTKAAEILGIPRRSLYTKIQEYNINLDDIEPENEL